MDFACFNCHNNVCARKVPLFSHLNEEELLPIISLIRTKQYKKGEIIVLDDSIIQGLYIFNTGKAKAYSISEDGKEQILYVFYEGDFFGEKGLVKEQRINFNVEALEDVKICMISQKDFKNLIADKPNIRGKIFDVLVERIDKLENMIELMSNKGIEARISSVIIEFATNYANRHNQDITDFFELPLSREGIANYIGVTRETVSRKLSSLADDGVLELVGNKKIRIINLKKLQNY
jgi:CRP/FNR family transcriptional regulator